MRMRKVGEVTKVLGGTFSLREADEAPNPPPKPARMSNCHIFTSSRSTSEACENEHSSQALHEPIPSSCQSVRGESE